MNLRVLKRNIPFMATASVCLLLYVVASVMFRESNFFSLRVFINFFNDNSFLGIAAIGMTFVILSGGIDLSVGGVIGLVSVLVAILIEKHNAHPAIAIPLVLVLGTGLGTIMGCLIHYFALPPFLVTLAGMFLARGLALVFQFESIPISHYFDAITSQVSLSLGKDSLGRQLTLPMVAILYFVAFLGALWLAHFTKFGRNIYAIGGNEQSATLMGLPVARTKIGVYALSGFCSALAGVVYSFYTSSGNPNAGMGLELDAIAAAVIGGTLLSGGVGFVAGTFIGVLIFGIIQTGISFHGDLNSWWTRIVIGGLLLIFIMLQKVIQTKRG